MGIGDWLRGQTEHCLMAVRGKPTVSLSNETTLLRAPVRAHSQKPEEFYGLESDGTITFASSLPRACDGLCSRARGCSPRARGPRHRAGGCALWIPSRRAGRRDETDRPPASHKATADQPREHDTAHCPAAAAARRGMSAACLVIFSRRRRPMHTGRLGDLVERPAATLGELLQGSARKHPFLRCLPLNWFERPLDGHGLGERPRSSANCSRTWTAPAA
jgi:hypothetical protein